MEPTLIDALAEVARRLNEIEAAIGAARKTGEEIVDLGHRGRAKSGPGLSLRAGSENAAPHHQVFALGHADALLLLIADGGQMGVKKVVRFLAPPLARQPHHLGQPLAAVDPDPPICARIPTPTVR
jgi:hypothetical protein